MSSDKNDSGRLLAQPKPGKLIIIFFFSLFHDADRRATKRLLHRVQHDAVEWRKRTSTSVSFVVQLAREKERGDRGPAPRRSAADAAPKKNGDQAKRARALRIHGVMKHPSIVPCMVKGAGNTAGELRTAGPSSNMLNRKRSGRGPGHMWLR